MVAGEQPGRGSSDRITLFKSNGAVLEDVVVSGSLFELARAHGLGQQIPTFRALPTFPG